MSSVDGNNPGQVHDDCSTVNRLKKQIKIEILEIQRTGLLVQTEAFFLYRSRLQNIRPHQRT